MSWRDASAPSGIPAQLLDFVRQPARLGFQFRAFLGQQRGPLRRQFLQHARLVLALVAADVRRLTSTWNGEIEGERHDRAS